MFTNVIFWISVALCLLGYFVYRFGMVSRGAKRVEIESVGGIITLISFILIFFAVGWKALFALILIFWVVITPIVEISVPRVFKKLLEL